MVSLTRQIQYAVLVLALVALCAPAASAQSRPFYKSGLFWSEVAVMGGSMLADWKTTCDGQKLGLVEGNLIDRGNKSCAVTSGILAAGFVTESTLYAVGWHLTANDSSRWFRVAGKALIPSLVDGMEGYAAYHNANLNASVANAAARARIAPGGVR